MEAYKSAAEIRRSLVGLGVDVCIMLLESTGVRIPPEATGSDIAQILKKHRNDIVEQAVEALRKADQKLVN
jgi:hypothetical protein